MFVEVDTQKTKYMYCQEETGKKSDTSQKTVSRNCFVFGFVYFVCFLFLLCQGIGKRSQNIIRDSQNYNVILR